MGGTKDSGGGAGDSGQVTITLSTSDAQNLLTALTQGVHGGLRTGKGTLGGSAKGKGKSGASGGPKPK